MISIEPKNIDVAEVYKLMVRTIIPRPIAWVSTCNENGVGNLAPFSYFNAIASRPATLMFVISATPDGTPKDTERNIEQLPEFVVNIVSESLFNPMVESSARYPYGVDELAKVGLTPAQSSLVKPHRVAESPINFECKVSQKIAIGDGKMGSALVVFGEILMVHINEEILTDDKVDPKKLQPVARLGGAEYARLGELKVKPTPKLT